MIEKELFDEMKKGDKKALEKWFNVHAESIARFAFQYGATISDAKEVAAAVFLQLFSELREIENERQLHNRMYQIAIEKLSNCKLTEENEFTFEEDLALHLKVIYLQPVNKLILILTSFSKMDASQCAEILSIRPEEIPQRYENILDELQENQLEKRLKLLQKSYERIAFHVDKERVFGDYQEQKIDSSKSIRLTSKRGIYLMLSGVAMLAALIIFSIINSEPYKRASTEKWIEQMKRTYEEQLSDVYEKLGLSEESIAESGVQDMFGRRYLGYEEKLHFERFIEGVERDFEKERELDKDKITKQFDEFVENLTVPTDMAKELFKKPLTNDLQASEEFLEQYIHKHYILSDIYLSLIYRYPDIAEELAVDGGIDLERLKNIDTFPGDVQQLLKKMEEQNIRIDFLHEESSSQGTEFYKKLRNALHPNVGGYVTILESAGHLFYVYSNEDSHESLEYIYEMEKTLQTTSMPHEFHQMLEFRYAYTLLSFLDDKGGELYGKDGRVNKEIRQEWEEIIALGENSAAAFIIEKVIAEFEENDWKVSNTQVFLEEIQIMEIVEYAKSHDVSTYQWEDIKHRPHSSVQLSSEGFMYIVATTYDQFKESYDQEILKNSHPLTVTGMFLFANEKKDAEMIWHLYDEKAKPGPLNAYVANWQQEEFLLNIYYLNFDMYSKMTHVSAPDTHGYLQLIQKKEGWFIDSIHKE